MSDEVDAHVGGDEDNEGESNMSEKKTLDMNDIVTEKKISRRSTMGVIGAGAAVLGVAAVVATPGEAHATCTDSDSGPNSDPAGRGRGRGVTDSDPSDSPGCGRRQCSDSDPSDPAGRGRRC